MNSSKNKRKCYENIMNSSENNRKCHEILLYCSENKRKCYENLIHKYVIMKIKGIVMNTQFIVMKINENILKFFYLDGKNEKMLRK